MDEFDRLIIRDRFWELACMGELFLVTLLARLMILVLILHCLLVSGGLIQVEDHLRYILYCMI
jgi:hypothetical protein